MSEALRTDPDFDQIIDEAARQWLHNQDGFPDGHPGVDDLISFQEKSLEEETALRIREHLKTCTECSDELEALGRFDAATPDLEPGSGAKQDNGWETFAAWRDQQKQSVGHPRTTAPLYRTLLPLAASIIFAFIGLGSLYVSQTPSSGEDSQLMVLDLLPDGTTIPRSSGDLFELQAPQEFQDLVFRLNVGKLGQGQEFEADLMEATTMSIVFNRKITRDPQGRLSFRASREALPDGDYRIVLFGLQDDDRVEIARYSFSLLDGD